jgi:hypothetical protein
MIDPFGEHSAPLASKRIQLLGAQFQFNSNSRELMKLVEAAYSRLPQHRLTCISDELCVSLILSAKGKHRSRTEPPPLSMLGGSGLLGGATDSSNFVLISAAERAALVSVSPAMLRFPYHTRYELIEFAVFTLAARAQQLIPLHAACVGQDGSGVLLIGASASGKSTVTLHCLLEGMDFLSEDSVFVVPQTMLATAVSNFVHVRCNSLQWFGKTSTAALIRNSPVIRRRSGVEKFEVNVRRRGFRLAQSPLSIKAIAFLSPQAAGRQPLLKPLPKSALRKRLAETQAYGASDAQWPMFSKNASALEAFELRRGVHPLEAVQALRSLLAAL